MIPNNRFLSINTCNMKKIIVAIGLLVTCSHIINAQTLDRNEVVLVGLFNRVKQAQNDSSRRLLNDSITDELSRTLTLPDAFTYAFDSVSYLGKVLGTDKKIRVYTWDIPLERGFLYNCAIQKNDGSVFWLHQRDTTYMPDKKSVIYPANWYGALYYKVIAYKYRHQNVYLLVGISRYRRETNVKMVDVLSFDKTGHVVLGMPIFHGRENEISDRLVYEFDWETDMHLDYNRRRHRLELDHLSPMRHIAADEMTFGPDMSVDGYVRKRHGWFYRSDLHVRNGKE